MLLSFDLGLKNMGACALNENGDIIAWNILNLKSLNIKDITLELDTWISCINIESIEQVRVILERQPWKNYKMTTLLIIMETYFTVAFPSYKIYKVGSNNKWKYLNKNVPLTYHERKRQIIKDCQILLNESKNNNHWINWFQSQEKKDDLADSYIQCLFIL